MAADRELLALTFTMDDLAVLRRFGIPALPVHGLARIRGEVLVGFLRSVGIQRTRDLDYRASPVTPRRSPAAIAAAMRPDVADELVRSRGLRQPTTRKSWCR